MVMRPSTMGSARSPAGGSKPGTVSRGMLRLMRRSIEEVGARTTAPFWYQLYVMRDRGFARELMQRASAAGCPVLTSDWICLVAFL